MLRLFQVLSVLDWITPAVGIVEKFINDPGQLHTWTFFIKYDDCLRAGYNAWQVLELMKKVGVKTWGMQMTGNEFMFSVRTEQANWAVYQLTKAGIPLKNKSYPPRFEEIKESNPKEGNNLLKWLFSKRTF